MKEAITIMRGKKDKARLQYISSWEISKKMGKRYIQRKHSYAYLIVQALVNDNLFERRIMQSDANRNREVSAYQTLVFR